MLKALVNLYESLVKEGQLDPSGWSKVKATYALDLTDDGSVAGVLILGEETDEEKGRRRVKGKVLSMPTQESRSSGIKPNFLCDNAKYILGLSKGEKARDAETAKKAFLASKALHEEILADVDSKAAKAILRFFESWEPEKAPTELEKLMDGTDAIKELATMGNVVFMYDGLLVDMKEPDIRDAWNEHYGDKDDSMESEAVCMVTGEKVLPVRKCPKLKFPNASLGVMLNSTNQTAFEAYGLKDGDGAPVGKYASYAYSQAWNWLIASEKNTVRVGDILFMFWAESEADDSRFSESYQIVIDPKKAPVSAESVKTILARAAEGVYMDAAGEILDGNKNFYVICAGVHQTSRLVAEFHRGTFGSFMAALAKHAKRMELCDPDGDQEPVTVREIVEYAQKKEIADANARFTNKLISDLMRSIFNDSQYPQSVFQMTMDRLQAESCKEPEPNERRLYERKNFVRLSFMKACITQKGEEKMEALNESSSNIAYVLGRLFATVEENQRRASGELNRNVKDRLFRSYSENPSSVFADVTRSLGIHNRKLGARNSYVAADLMALATDLMNELGPEIPRHLNRAQQASLHIGYYHQMAEFKGQRHKNA